MAALYLEDAYNIVDSKILMRTLLNMNIDRHIIIWKGGSLLKRKMVLRVVGLRR